MAARLSGWADDAASGEKLIGADQDLREASRVITVLSSNLARIERNRDMWKAQCENQAAELSTLRAQNAALQAVASAASIAAEELEYFVDFAVRQCEFEGDEVAGYAAVNAVRNALAQVAK